MNEGKVAEDYWTDIETLNYEDAEQIGYPTQKPYRLLERIINSSSENGDVVADFFCGGGTTLSAAQRLGRRWIGCDISRIAVAITADRVTNIAIQSNNGGNQAVQQTIVPSADDEVHGYKDGIPLYVGSPSQDGPITKDQVIDFGKTVRTKKGKNHGIMLAWAFAPSAQTAAAKLEDEKKVGVEFVKISLVPIESEDFRKTLQANTKKIACKVQDDKGGEKTEVIELEVK